MVQSYVSVSQKTANSTVFTAEKKERRKKTRTYYQRPHFELSFDTHHDILS